MEITGSRGAVFNPCAAALFPQYGNRTTNVGQQQNPHLAPINRSSLPLADPLNRMHIPTPKSLKFRSVVCILSFCSMATKESTIY